jgi:hypothetical protein
VAAIYGIIQLLHFVYGLFFALLIVCAIRGVLLCIAALSRREAPVPVPAKVAKSAVPLGAVPSEGLAIRS